MSKVEIRKHASLLFKAKQRGLSLLLFLFVLFGLFSSVLMYALSPSASRLRHAEITEQRMVEAKDALIAYAVADRDLPGRLPCPEDTSLIGKPNEGNSLTSCSSTALQTGRLPWRTLGLNKPENTGEPLWYVISQGFSASPINSNSLGQLQLDGAANAAVALIIAPGTPLAGQSRSVASASSAPMALDYLDLSNATGPAYLSTGPTNTFNDKVLAISTNELFRVVEKRVVKEARVALENYYLTYGYYPKPANFSDTTCLGTSKILIACNNDASTCNSTVCRGRIPANPSSGPWQMSSILRGTIDSTPRNWFQENGWRELFLYAVSPNCAETACAPTGFLTIQTTDQTFAGLKSILILGGAAISAQLRTNNTEKTIQSNYFEGKNISPPDNIFATFSGTSFNDVAAW